MHRFRTSMVLAIGLSTLAGISTVAGGEKQSSRAVAKATARPRPKVLMPVGDASEVVDTLYPFFRLQEEGFQVVVAGPQARMYHMVTHEVPPEAAIPWDITQEGPGYHIKAEIAFRDVYPDEYAGLFLSGGRAPEYLRYDQDLLRITRHFFTAHKPVAVVCHGVEIAAAAGVLKGRKMTTVAKCGAGCDAVWRSLRRATVGSGRQPGELPHLARLPHAVHEGVPPPAWRHRGQEGSLSRLLFGRHPRAAGGNRAAQHDGQADDARP